MRPSATVPFAGRRPIAVADAQAVAPVTSEFLGEHFPEHAFPPVAEREQDYRRCCERGYATMGQTRVAITGLARNLADVLPTTIRRIERLRSLFADSRVVVYENDSTDATKLLLQNWAASDDRVQIMLEDCRDPRNPPKRCTHRAERMARYRQRCQQMVLDTCGHFDATIVIDLDVAGGWSEDGVASSFGYRDWDFIGSNGLIFRREGMRINTTRQYDMWALRFDADFSPIPTAHAARYVYARGEPLVPVTCCFGGLGIYRMEAYRHGRYGTTDTEHAGFHRELIRAGFPRLYLNPSQILVYGRRHRFGDPVVAAVRRAWESISGRPATPWVFGPGRRQPVTSPAPAPAAIQRRAV
jgi:hypothetical protein